MHMLQMPTCEHVYQCVRMWMRVRVCAYVYVCILVCMCVRMNVQMYVCVCITILSVEIRKARLDAQAEDQAKVESAVDGSPSIAETEGLCEMHRV
jgi:hypothetical protein